MQSVAPQTRLTVVHEHFVISYCSLSLVFLPDPPARTKFKSLSNVWVCRNSCRDNIQTILMRTILRYKLIEIHRDDLVTLASVLFGEFTLRQWKLNDTSGRPNNAIDAVNFRNADTRPDIFKLFYVWVTIQVPTTSNETIRFPEFKLIKTYYF